MNVFKTLATGTALALGLAGAAVAQDPTKVGFIYVGPIGDGGWTFEHNEGRLAVEEHFGEAVEISTRKACRKAPTPNARSPRWCWPAPI